MTQIHLNLINFPYRERLSDIFSDYPDEFEFTAEGVFRRALDVNIVLARSYLLDMSWKKQ